MGSFATVLLITTTKTETSQKESETTIQAECDLGDSQGLEGPLGGTNYQRSSTFKNPRSKDSNSETPLPNLILYPPNIYPKLRGRRKDVS